MEFKLTKGKKINFNQLLLGIVEHGKPLLLLLMLVVLSLAIWFIFQYVYVPLTRAVELAELKESTSVVRPDTELLDQTIEKGETRTTIFTTDWSKVRNPFSTPPPPATEAIIDDIELESLDINEENG